MGRFRQNSFEMNKSNFFSLTLLLGALLNCVLSQTEVNNVGANFTTTIGSNRPDSISFPTTTPAGQASTIGIGSGFLGTTTVSTSKTEISTQIPTNQNTSNAETTAAGGTGTKLGNTTHNSNFNTTAADGTNPTNTTQKNSEINLQLVPDGKLELRIDANEETIVFTVQINFTDWEFNHTNTKKNMTSDLDSKTLLIGFETEDSSHHMFLDVVSIPLNDHKDIKDSHWNKKDKALVPDSSQNYQLLSLTGTNKTTFSVQFSRKWKTCDDDDIQFTNAPLKIWWLLDPFSQEDKEIVPGTPKYANIEKENSTESPMTSTSVVTVFLNETELLDDGNNTNGEFKSRTSTMPGGKNKTDVNSSPSNKNASIGKDVEVFKKYQEFNGPVIVPTRELLNNFSFVVIHKNCENRTEPRSYICSLSELENRTFTHSHFSVTKGILPNSKILDNESREIKKINNCPTNEILNGNATTVNALTSGKRQGKENGSKENVATNPLKTNQAQFLTAVSFIFIGTHFL